MIRLSFAFLLSLCVSAQAQLSGGVGGFPGPGTAHTSVTYVGPGDVKSGAYAWAGMRAYNAAKAGTKAISLCDDTGANCSDISTNATTGVLNAGGTHGSNNCDSTGTCRIQTFYDQSGGTNCSGTACDLTQATNAKRALFIPNCIGALPCADFQAASGMEYASANNITALAQPLSISAVTTFGASPTGIILADSSFNFQFAIVSGPAIRMYGGTVQDTVLSASTSHAIQAVYNGASSDINIDGTRTTKNPGTAGLATVTANKLSLGSAAPGGANLTARIMEAGAWGLAFSSGEETSICHNQFLFWGTATSC